LRDAGQLVDQQPREADAGDDFQQGDERRDA
jgi:hypothetical protein